MLDWSQTKKAVNQWLDAPDDRDTRIVFVTGDFTDATLAWARALGACTHGWSRTEGWPLASGGALGPDAVALAAWLTPADVLALDVPEDAPRVSALLAAHPTAAVAWIWQPWATSVEATLAADATGGRHALEQILDGEHPSLELSDALQGQVEGLDDGTPATAAALRWYLRHSTALTGGLPDDPRVHLLPHHQATTAWPSLCDALGLSGPGPSPGTAHTAAPEVPAPLARLCEALTDALQARAPQPR